LVALQRKDLPMKVSPIVALGVIAASAAPAVAIPAPQLFAQRCAMCHQSNGAGLPNQFPRLAGRVSTIAQAAPGRRYLALVLLNGMVGKITADGQSISGLMPSMAALKDQEIADLLNHAAGLGAPPKGKKPAPFTAKEIATVRAGGTMSASAVSAERAKLPAGILP
jgi:cytochrome c553